MNKVKSIGTLYTITETNNKKSVSTYTKKPHNKESKTNKYKTTTTSNKSTFSLHHHQKCGYSVAVKTLQSKSTQSTLNQTTNTC